MSKILISWVAFNSDFKDGKVDKANSPNYNMHHHFWKYDKHILLSAKAEEDTRLNHLLNALRKDYPDHVVEEVYMDIPEGDVINLTTIKPRVESLLLKYASEELDIFFSPGTSVMQLAWFICHNTLGLNSHLIQMRPQHKAKSGKPELIELEIETSAVPMTAMLKQQSSSGKNEEKYLISASIKPVYDKAIKIAQTDIASTLILGESGTGKEHLARYIHEQSARNERPFITVNCSAFSDSLLESRLFGYKKGAFTGADKDTQGLFEQANGGTIFLDEIGDISPYMQQSLLRVIQNNEISPIGGTTKKINVRVVSATNRKLAQMCGDGKFRWDLYYRLAVVELELPSLQERGTRELSELLDFFLKEKKKTLRKKNVLKLTKDAKTKILSYPFPGNVRELENLVENLYVFCEETVKPEDLPKQLFSLSGEKSLKWKDVEKAHIEKVLTLYKDNQRQAWLALGYGSINTLKSKMKEYGV